jgi:hypothetical protein
MGEIIVFPDVAGTARGGRHVDAKTESATVIILPVVRIERGPDSSNDLRPTPRSHNGRRRRRRNER